MFINRDSLSNLSDDFYIITFIDSNYYNVFDNWYESIREYDQETCILVFCLDSKVSQSLVDYEGVITINALSNSEFSYVDLQSTLWILRADIFNYLIHKNISFVHSDVDCIWLKNIFKHGFSEENRAKYDIIATPGITWPNEMVTKNKFVLCMGLIYFGSTHRTKALTHRLSTKTEEVKDDQEALNLLLKEYEFDYGENIYHPNVGVNMHGERQDIEYYEFDTEIVSNKVERILILPHTKYIRNHNSPHSNISPVTLHPILPKNQKDKLKILTELKPTTSEIHTFVINLDNQQSRFRDTSNLLNSLDDNLHIKRFPAVNGHQLPNNWQDVYDIKVNLGVYTYPELPEDHENYTIDSNVHFNSSVGAYGIYLSNYLIWKQMVDEDIEYALIVEDDILCDFKCLDLIDIIKMNYYRDVIWLSQYFYEVGCAGIEAYVLFNSGARKLLKKKNIDHAVDRKVVKLCKDGYLNYIISDKKFYQNKDLIRSITSYKNVYITNLYNERNVLKAKELLFALEYNISQLTIDDLFIIYFDDNETSPGFIYDEILKLTEKYRPHDELGKDAPLNVKLIKKRGRVKYETLFEKCRELNAKRFFILNADILLSQDVQTTADKLTDNQVISLTRYNIENPTHDLRNFIRNSKFDKSESDKLLQIQDLKIEGQKGFSSDVWIFCKKFAHEKDFDMEDVCIGTPVCDSFLHTKLLNSRLFDVYNPCKDVKSIHVDSILTNESVMSSLQAERWDTRKQYEDAMHNRGFIPSGIYFEHSKLLSHSKKFLKNGHEIIVTGLRRSGNHVVSNYIISHFEDDSVFYLNDVDPFKNNYYPGDIHQNEENDWSDHYIKSYKFVHNKHTDVKDTLIASKLIEETSYFEALYGNKQLFLHTYEDRSMDELKLYLDYFNYYGESDNKFILVVLRDINEIVSSRTKQANSEWLGMQTNHGTNQSNPKHDIVNLYNKYLDYCIDDSQIFQNYKTIYIFYEKFIKDENYRKTLSEKINAPNFGNQNLIKTNFGGGSSFDDVNSRHEHNSSLDFSEYVDVRNKYKNIIGN